MAEVNSRTQSMQKAQAVVRMLHRSSKRSVKTTEAVGSAVNMMTNFNKRTGGPCRSSANWKNVLIDEQLDCVFEEDDDEEAPWSCRRA